MPRSLPEKPSALADGAFFRPFGSVREEVAAARERGVVFDIGHGGGSFGFRTAEGMLAAGFSPDVISSDVHS